MLAHAVWWLVHRSNEVNNWSQAEQDFGLDKAYGTLRAYYPAIDTVPTTYRCADSVSPIWQHARDPKPQVEQYHRALQVLRYCDQSAGLARAKGWEDFFRNDKLFKSRLVRQELVPHWMKEHVDEGDSLARVDECNDEGQVQEDVALAVDAPAPPSNERHVSEGDHIQRRMSDGENVEGIKEITQQERLEQDTVAEQEIPLKQQIKGEDYTTAIVIIDDEDIRLEDDHTPSEIIQPGTQPPSKSACSILYITNRKISRARCKNKKWFDECWEEMECLDAPTTNRIATVDPRDWSTGEEWRDAARKELRLGTHWRRDEDEGLALKLTSLRLQARGEKLNCYGCKAEQFSSTPKQVSEFVEKHRNCELEYCIDFFTEAEMADGKANDLETLKSSS
ncbi:hypothetical protein CBER1_08964 [Cercospora berteroae]|uniref:Uncharacterized protein n=1 Tax=Cercospora berteroae TaxID=357750 RepID=A0A2S6C5F4_9PEZI|nr:hypothetical protein CBER1_08964 [Cercospora berteroae]